MKPYYLIHADGPVYTDTDDDPTHLANCCTNCLDLALKHHLKSISFPAISTGIFFYSSEKDEDKSYTLFKRFLMKKW